MSGKNKVEVRIAGKEYTLVGVESEEYLQKVALYIDKKMNGILRTNSKLSTSMAAVLTAINVADDYFRTYENESQQKKEMKKAQEELERLRDENKRLKDENSELSSKNSSLQIELVKREAELSEARSSAHKPVRRPEQTEEDYE